MDYYKIDIDHLLIIEHMDTQIICKSELFGIFRDNEYAKIIEISNFSRIFKKIPDRWSSKVYWKRIYQKRTYWNYNKIQRNARKKLALEELQYNNIGRADYIV